MDGDVEITMAQAHIDIQKHDFRGGGVPSKFDGITAVEMFKGEGVRTMRAKEGNVIDKMQLETELLEREVKEILFKETHKRVNIGGVYSSAQCSSLYLEIKQ
jgi:hypothetical protein